MTLSEYQIKILPHTPTSRAAMHDNPFMDIRSKFQSPLPARETTNVGIFYSINSASHRGPADGTGTAASGRWSTWSSIHWRRQKTTYWRPESWPGFL